MTAWIDSHCHLDSVEGGADAAVERARAAGVAAMVTVGTDLASSRQSIEIAAGHDCVWAAVGVHPHDASTFSEEALEELGRLAEHPRVVAIGEAGLDYHRELSPRDTQRDAFRRQIQAARRLGKALVIHMRDAHEDVYAILADVGPPGRVVFHCFSGGPQEAARALDLGGFVSFAGNVSFRNAGELRDAARTVPLDRLLVETDSPYLAPVPHRGRPNEPALVGAVGSALAEATGRPVEEIARATAGNAVRAFGLHPLH